MKTYLVGGAVRDQLLGLAIKERDWVIVGAQPQQLLEQGFSCRRQRLPSIYSP